jgi:outer membrane protein OmpA-like peptidoglycan-associated protein
MASVTATFVVAAYMLGAASPVLADDDSQWVPMAATFADATEINAPASQINAPAYDISAPVNWIDGSFTDDASGQTEKVTLAADVLFAFNEANLSPEAQSRISDVAQAIREKRATSISINGYTDSLGADGYNRDLSQRRAEAVESALQQIFSDSDITFTSTGHGAEDPVAPNVNADGSDNPAGRAKNRRVTVSF